MSDVLLFTLIIGVIVIALGVDLAVVLGWLARRWR